MKEYIRKYFCQIDELYNIKIIIRYSIISLILIILGDYLNVISRLLSSAVIMLIVVLGICFFVVQYTDIRLYEMIKVQMVNDIDCLLVYLLITSMCGAIVVTILNNGITYKFYIFIGAAICTMIIVALRIIYCSSREQKEDNVNVYDLKQLYNGDIKECRGLILIDEVEVNYDLLNRERIISDIYDLIIQCNPKKKFVLSLEGTWGSGKTTIINNVKSKLINNRDIIIIDEFDPWSYSNECSMFRGMFDAILHKTGIKYSISKTREYVNDLYNILFDSDYGNGIRALKIYRQDDENEILRIKSMINKYLDVSNKKVIFIIDNIDRAEAKNVIMLFKLVGNIFDFERIIYLLSFDDLRVKSILENNLEIDYEYLKKIIQVQVKVPEISQKVKEEVVGKCLNNLLVLYGEKELSNYASLIKEISAMIVDIRDLKRILNSVISFSYKSNKYLCLRDVIVIKLIELYNYELFYSIKDNPQYYLSYDKEFNTEAFSAVFDKNSLNQNAKKYFDDLFRREENKKYKRILAEIFPYVDKYIKGHKLEEESGVTYIDREKYSKVIRNRSVSSAKYFDLYFTQDKNEFIIINNEIESYIKDLNRNNSRDEAENKLNRILTVNPEYYHKVLFETLQCYVEQVIPGQLANLAYSIFSNIYYINNSSQFMGLSARERAQAIIADILLKISNEEFILFMSNIEEQYDKLYIISSVGYWIEKSNEVKEELKGDRQRQWNLLLNNMGARVYDDNIDLYNDYYHSRNIWGLYHAIKGTSREIKTYVSKVISIQNVVRVLFDTCGVSIGRGYQYSINSKNFDELTSTEEIGALINNRVSNTNDEQFVLDVYQRFKENTTDEWGEKGIICDKERILNI